MDVHNVDPFAALGSFVGSLALGWLKSRTTILDGKLGAVVKPFQPFVVAAATIGLPYATQALGIGAVDAATFATAPFSVALAISTREALVRMQRKLEPLR